MIEKRRAMMGDWASFLSNHTGMNELVRFESL